MRSTGPLSERQRDVIAGRWNTLDGTSGGNEELETIAEEEEGEGEDDIYILAVESFSDI